MHLKPGLTVVLVTSLLALGADRASSGNKQQKSSSATDIAAIKDQALRVWQAYETKDPGKARPFYSAGATNVYYDIAPLQYRGIDAYQRGVAQLLNSFRSLTFVPAGDLEVHPMGNQAWSTETLQFAGTRADGNKTNMQIRWTAIWNKERGNWVIAHEHVSAPLGTQPEQEQNIQTRRK